MIGSYHRTAYLDHFGKVHVDVFRGIATADSVVVDLRTGAARPDVSHLPEVIGAAEGEHVTLGEVPAPPIMPLDNRITKY